MAPKTKVATPVATAALQTAPMPSMAPKTPSNYATANANPDRLQANIGMARLYAQQIKRVPTVDEFLEFLYANGYYTGSWEQTLGQRIARVTFVIQTYVAKYFDPSKLAGTAKHIPINLDKWNNFVKQFPHVWIATRNKYGFDKRCHLTREDAQGKRIKLSHGAAIN